MKDLIERRLADPTLPMEEAFSQHLKEEELELPAGQFALFMNSMYAVDAYVRDYFRKAALDALLAKKLPVTVFGEGWEKYSCGDGTACGASRRCRLRSPLRGLPKPMCF